MASAGTPYSPAKKILFLYTEKTEPILEKIVEYCNLPVRSFTKELVEETDPLSIYRRIKEIYLKWKKPDRIYIDFTGGTKAMSAAAALAGTMIDVQLLYVGTENYLVDMRKPEPGSETLVFIENPVAVFGDLEIEKAMVLFAQYNYTGAKEKLSHLMKTVPEPNIRQQVYTR